jgi:hypothetical protein
MSEALSVPSPLQAAPLSCSLSASALVGISNTAIFSGTITGGSGYYSWVLGFGDGSSTSGSGASVSVEHTYSAGGAYVGTLSASDVAGGLASCFATVTVGSTTTTTTTSSTATSTVSTGLSDVVGLSDGTANSSGQRLNETIAILDGLLMPLKTALNESVFVVDVYVTKLPYLLDETIRVIQSTGTRSGSTTSAQTSTSGGGIPEFTFQTVAATAFISVLVVYYLLTRQNRNSATGLQ